MRFFFPALRRAFFLYTGRQVVELVLSEGTKGPALADQKAAANADVVIFFGDDPTDEEIFTSLSTTDVGVKVGPGQTAARFALQDPASVVEAIEYLVGERRRLR